MSLKRIFCGMFFRKRVVPARRLVGRDGEMACDMPPLNPMKMTGVSETLHAGVNFMARRSFIGPTEDNDTLPANYTRFRVTNEVDAKRNVSSGPSPHGEHGNADQLPRAQTQKYWRRPTAEQDEELRRVFEETPYPNRHMIKHLSAKMHLNEQDITVWFRNRRYLTSKNRNEKHADSEESPVVQTKPVAKPWERLRILCHEISFIQKGLTASGLCRTRNASQPTPLQHHHPGTTHGIKRKRGQLEEFRRSDRFSFRKNDIIRSEKDKYLILEHAGEGASGKVVLCWAEIMMKLVAVKILKKRRDLRFQKEISILKELGTEDADKFNIIRMYESFMYKKFTCIVFETLEQDLLCLINEKNGKQIPLFGIKLILKQILTALVKLKNLKVIHADLKPENIMLIEQKRKPYQVKVIDFGNAMYTSKAYFPAYIQSRYYRAPEVILGLPFDEKIDIWSAACVAAELFLGRPLFPGHSEYDQIRCIMRLTGFPPTHILNSGAKTVNFFRSESQGYRRYWRLKTPEEYQSEGNVRSTVTKKYLFQDLDELIDINIPKNLKKKDLVSEMADRKKFVDLLKRMLAFKQKERISPEEALAHHFFW